MVAELRQGWRWLLQHQWCDSQSQCIGVSPAHIHLPDASLFFSLWGSPGLDLAQGHKMAAALTSIRCPECRLLRRMLSLSSCAPAMDDLKQLVAVIRSHGNLSHRRCTAPVPAAVPPVWCSFVGLIRQHSVLTCVFRPSL